MKIIPSTLVSILLIAIFISGCAGQYDWMFETFLDPIPVREGNLITIEKSEPPDDPNEQTLAIHWFGTSSYDIRLGDLSVLTDPFVSYKEPHKIIGINRSENYMASDIHLVKRTYGELKAPPTAIFIGHSHYDHMMDTVAALELPGWRNVPVYGSQTTRHILAGYPKNASSEPHNLCSDGNVIPPVKNWSDNWCLSVRSKNPEEYDWIVIEPNLLYYQSFKATHAHHIAGVTLWNKKLNKDIKRPPEITNDFQMGKTYIHIFELKASKGAGYVSYKVAIVGAATSIKKYKLGDELKRFVSDNKLDVLILSVPGWDNIKDHAYPKNLIDILRPRIILLTHYDNFFNEEREDDLERLVPTANFNEFLNKLQKDIQDIDREYGYDEFESILIPGVGTTIYLNKPASGVINVSKLLR